MCSSLWGHIRGPQYQLWPAQWEHPSSSSSGVHISLGSCTLLLCTGVTGDGALYVCYDRITRISPRWCNGITEARCPAIIGFRSIFRMAPSSTPPKLQLNHLWLWMWTCTTKDVVVRQRNFFFATNTDREWLVEQVGPLNEIHKSIWVTLDDEWYCITNFTVKYVNSLIC